MTSRTAIEVKGLVKVYGDLQAVDGIDLSVLEGTVFALLGPNGAGKTTTVEILEGLRKPTSGSAWVLGHDVTAGYERIRDYVGILPQDFEPFDRLTPREHLKYFGALFGRSLTQEEVTEILSMVRLEDRARVQARKLSGGEKRKLGIALSLVGKPRLVFLDEPTTGLDPAARRDLWRIVRGLREAGHTVLLTTHYIEEAETLADEVAIMVRGRIVAQGSPEELKAAEGDGKRLRLLGTGPVDLETLADRGIEAEQAGEDLVLRAPAGPDLVKALSVLPDLGIEFKDLRTEGPSLEDVFLRLVGARMEEGELRP